MGSDGGSGLENHWDPRALDGKMFDNLQLAKPRSPTLLKIYSESDVSHGSSTSLLLRSCRKHSHSAPFPYGHPRDRNTACATHLLGSALPRELLPTTYQGPQAEEREEEGRWKRDHGRKRRGKEMNNGADRRTANVTDQGPPPVSRRQPSDLRELPRAALMPRAERARPSQV